jgi:predicted NUDIX family phosphoesterase
MTEQVEQILVVPREKLFDGKPIPQGFNSADLQGLIERIHKHAYFIDRPKAENNPQLKQIIPYIKVMHKGKIYTLHRQTAQTEKRLHNKYSIGVGGHINPVDESNISGILGKGLERELHEELCINCGYKYELIGYINDDTNDVGKVHFGMVYGLVVEDDKAVSVAEKDMMVGQFMNIPELEKIYPSLETWSQLVFNNHKNENKAAQ